MLNAIQGANLFPITATDIVLNIAVALMCGLAIAWLYRNTYRGPGYSIAFVNSIVYLTMITAVVILAIGSNLARAFGLVGAMSIIRFRTAVKETQDIVYIFFSLAVGRRIPQDRDPRDALGRTHDLHVLQVGSVLAAPRGVPPAVLIQPQRPQR